MDSHVRLLACLLLAVLTAHPSAQGRFLISAPSVFHVGVKEQVFVQLSPTEAPMRLYLEDINTGALMTEKVLLRTSQEVGSVELEIQKSKIPQLSTGSHGPASLHLVCEVGEQRKMVKVLVSQHRGYIFIQTDQPVYNPTQQVKYRIFTLDHSMKPTAEVVSISVFNALGNRIQKYIVTTKNGIFFKSFHIPDISETGVWRITAHYDGDDKNPSTREIVVQRFVMPSFKVSVQPETSYFLSSSESLSFTIRAEYSYGEQVSGVFHSRFGWRCKTSSGDGQKQAEKTQFIRGLEQANSVTDGAAQLRLETSKLREELKNVTLLELAEGGAQLYVAVSVVDKISGELQEAEVSLPIVSQPYLVDLSRIRSHFIPGMPLDVLVLVKLPNGQPAPNVPVEISVAESADKSKTTRTTAEGSAADTFNLPLGEKLINIDVKVNGVSYKKKLLPTWSPSNSFLHISVSNNVHAVGDSIKVQFNGQTEGTVIYYMVLSRGGIKEMFSTKESKVTEVKLTIKHHMIPFFRLIGYYYDQNGDVVADSVWVDVKDSCAEQPQVSVDLTRGQPFPGSAVKLKIDVGPQKARVALLAVDKAIYALNNQNKFTAKQIFTAMGSYDLGCSYGGGADPTAVFADAGISVISSSEKIRPYERIDFRCESGFRRFRRSLDLQQKMLEKEYTYSDKKLQSCCRSGLTLLPMALSCEERARRVTAADCRDVFLECCKYGDDLRKKKTREDKRYFRSGGMEHIEDFFETEEQTIRQFFPYSFAFNEIEVAGKAEHTIGLPDSITTWEIQAVSVSASHGICVAEPLDILAFKEVFVALRLPYSVKRFEQLSISPVIYNYAEEDKQFAVHMKQAEGLCSPAASTSSSYVKVEVKKRSSSTVTFSSVPMRFGEIPITIQLYDIDKEMGEDAIRKPLMVKEEGFMMRDEETYNIHLDGRSAKTISLDGRLPNRTVPGTDTNIFVSMEGEVFGKSTAVQLLSPEKVNGLLELPDGCAEQTMSLLSPTALSIRYLDRSKRWGELKPGRRDEALNYLEKGYARILQLKKEDGSYGSWRYPQPSTWLTALVVKVMSLILDLQLLAVPEPGRPQVLFQKTEVQESVRFLIGRQNEDGSFFDPHPVVNRQMQGGVGGMEADVSRTAFITAAVCHSRNFLENVLDDAESLISKSISYLLRHLDNLQMPYAVAISAYCLSECQGKSAQSTLAWEKLKKLAKDENGCKVWRSDANLHRLNEEYPDKVPKAIALLVETTGYALLTALAHEDMTLAHGAVCFLASQENYEGGFKSTQDTIVALEALSKFAELSPKSNFSRVSAEFQIAGKSLKEELVLEKRDEPVETDLKRLVGNEIHVVLTGEADAKMKVVKAYHSIEPLDACKDVSISVTVSGKVQYTQHVMDTYDYEDYEEDRREEEDVPRSSIDWFDARSRRRRRDTQPDQKEDLVQYNVCVSHSKNLSGMAVADISLLSGFEALTEDLNKLKDMEDKYISHYEISHGRVLLYFDEIDGEQCVAFGAKQTVQVSLVQPAPAVLYDYYEPDRRCTIFYSAPKRSRMVSMLCTEDVCECAERPCFKERETFTDNLTKLQRMNHACYSPVADYGYKVHIENTSTAGAFDLYTGRVTDVLRTTRDNDVKEDSVRVFAKRRQCKGQLERDRTYLIMGKDGSTTDPHGQMQYLLDSSAWVEPEPSGTECTATKKRKACREFSNFISAYSIDGCTQ